MSNRVRTDKQLTIAAMGVGSAALTGVGLGLIEALTGHALYSVSLGLLLPIGAILAGFAAASGYYFGAKYFHQKPAGGLGLNIVLVSISAYLLVHYVPYYLIEVDGVRVKDAISFWSYLDLDIRHASLSSISSKRDISTVELGSIFGYIYVLIQLIGFSIGSFLVFFTLLDTPFCKKCSKYLHRTNTQDRYTSEGEALYEKIKIFATNLDERKYVEALEFHADQMGVSEYSGQHLRTRVTIHKCKTCGINHLDLETSRLEGNDWKPVIGSIRLWADHRID